MQQRVTVLASPEEALVINTQVDNTSMIDAITAINDRTEAICDLLVKSVQSNLIKSHLLCSVTWQLQANMDCLMLFVNRYIKKQQQLCVNLINVARKKATDIIMLYGVIDKTVWLIEEAAAAILSIKQYVKAVTSIACYQEIQTLA